MLINKVRTQHSLVDFLPVALLHRYRLNKVTTKLTNEHRMVQVRLAKKRKLEQEVKDRARQQELLEKLKVQDPQKYHDYMMAQQMAQYRNRGLISTNHFQY